jgi:Cu(I)/Ag(I) efflux system membrane fusion protein/cobalt-zinc-cadmium efflux system membrane fusion protein
MGMGKRGKRVIVGVAIVAVLGAGTFLADRQLGLLERFTAGEADSTEEEAEHDHGGLYTCPMHPEVVQSEPGTCPICKMDLVPMKGARGGIQSADATARVDHAHGGSDSSTIQGKLNGFDGMPATGTKAFCPVMQNEFTVEGDSAKSEHEGKTYVFCCPMCKPTFDENPERYIKILSDREAAAEQEAPEEQPEAAASKERKIKHWVAPMDATYISDKPGKSPMGMDLVPVYEDSSSAAGTRGTVTIDPVVVQNMGVRVAEVEHGPIFRHVKTMGEVLIAEDQVSVVNLRFSGWIDRIMVDETGQEVKKGQALFTVYSPELVTAQEEYLLAVNAGGADSRLARSSARRLELWGIWKGLLKRIVKNGKSTRNITITAPRAGYVLHKNVVEGAHIQAGEDLYRIGDLDQIWVNAEVYEHDAAWVQLGQKATMELSFQQGKTWEGIISYVYPRLNPKTRSLTVRLEFENPGLSLRPGMLATVRIETRRKDHATTVPAEAVIHSGERRLVFVAKGGGHYEAREVVIGLMADNRRTEVLEGLHKGELVVVSGQFLLDSESQLQEAVQKLLDSRLEYKRKQTGGVAADRGDDHGDGDKLVYWTCPMHPEVVQEGPGTCPKCGMDLVEKKR